MFDQLAVVEEAMRTRGWNPQIAEELAQRLGVTRRTVYNLRNRAIQWTKRQLRTEDIEARRAEQYQLADQAAREARAKGDYAGCAALLKVQGSLTGTIAPTNVNVRHAVTLVDPRLAAEVSRKSVAELESDAQRLLGVGQVIEAVAVPVTEESTGG